MSDRDAPQLDVLVATYAGSEEAEGDLKSVRDLHRKLGASHDFDAAIVVKTPAGTIKIDKTCATSTRHNALEGLGFGLAAGVVATLFPAIGIAAALSAGVAGGAAIGAMVEHINAGISRTDLKEIGELLDISRSALIVVYETKLAGQVANNLTAINYIVATISDLKAERIAEAVSQAAA